MARKYADRQQPWLLLIEFPSHADARAAQELLAEQFFEPTVLRPKVQFPSAGNIASWRLTQRLRDDLGNRSFGREEVNQVCIANGYRAKSNMTWLTSAVKAGVIERLTRGEYRFLPLLAGAVATHSLHDPLCLSCQPEALQCAAH